ncbi:gas vesicle protein GvpO [Streptomyces aurantiogriseus]|uniref:gas vesicle protein GvpO n=1 Tax=Streptomyces aurantiogriseus TaxID=66870 RepID=UPI0016725CB1|nr:gas vesicle protein [Streptomyces aurantiogriseus]
MSNTKNTSHAQTSRNSPKSDSGNGSRDASRDDDSSNDRSDNVADDRPTPMEVLRQARSQLAELTGMAAESVSSFEQTEDGWSLEIEVMELARVPDTMSLMASYQVDLDPQGQLTGYRRVRRYERGRADAHRPGGR